MLQIRLMRKFFFLAKGINIAEKEVFHPWLEELVFSINTTVQNILS